jgi:hypothetical protein
MMVERHEGKEEMLSDAVIDGPPGTDFTIKLNSSRFRMNARFLTDFTDNDMMKVRALLETRRLYGYSERQLPLYEEDRQQKSITLRFDEQVVVLPFGHKGDNEQLRIVIVPAISNKGYQLPNGKPRPLEIKIVKQSPGGAIEVEAFKMPHHYDVEACIIENGKEIACDRSAVLIEEARDLLLKLPQMAGAAPDQLAVRITIESYARSRPSDTVTLKFDVDRLTKNGGNRSHVVSNWSGISSLDRVLTYDLPLQLHRPAGNKYELRINVRLAKGESVD